MLVGDELPLPGPVADGVGADRPEIGSAADQHAIAEDHYPAVAALHAIEHIGVDRIEPVLHDCNAAPGPQRYNLGACASMLPGSVSYTHLRAHETRHDL